MKTEVIKIKEWANQTVSASKILLETIEDAISDGTDSVVVVLAAQKLLSRALAQAATSTMAARHMLSDTYYLLKEDTLELCKQLKK